MGKYVVFSCLLLVLTPTGSHQQSARRHIDSIHRETTGMRLQIMDIFVSFCPIAIETIKRTTKIESNKKLVSILFVSSTH